MSKESAMIAVDPESMCKQAQAYYYQYLCGERVESIRPEIVSHIGCCRICRSEVDRLKTILAETKDQAAESCRAGSSAAVANLRLHFAYTGAHVRCSTVRPFLPGLTAPALNVRVPTPVTAHIDQCQQCAGDLEVIQDLNLTQRQLLRLGQLFAEMPDADSQRCSGASACVGALARISLDECDAEDLEHLRACPACREKLYQCRRSIVQDLQKEGRAQDGFACESVTEADLFDYFFPYGLNPADDQYAELGPALTSHLRGCPICLGKMQRLHRIVYGILERPDSGVVTCFTFEQQNKTYGESDTADLYAGWPVRVEVLDRPAGKRGVPSAAPAPPQAHKRTLRKPNWARLVKPAAVAAAVILAAALLLNVPTAGAVDLGQIHEALERIRNVCITTFFQDESKPTQEIWVSRTLNVKMLTTRTQCVLWDVSGKLRKSKDLSTGSITMAELNDDVLARVVETMEGPLGLLPFNAMPEAPQGAEWQAVTNKNIEAYVRSGDFREDLY